MSITQRQLNQSVFRSFIRGGEEGGCVACQRPISDHVDKRGVWLGCSAGGIETTFILVPVRTVRSNTPIMESSPAPMRRASDKPPVKEAGNGNGNGHATAAAPVRTVRSNRPIIRSRFKYQVADRRVRPELSPVRAKLYDTLREHPQGLVSYQLMRKAGLVHGSVQQTLNWLRNHNLVTATAINE